MRKTEGVLEIFSALLQVMVTGRTHPYKLPEQDGEEPHSFKRYLLYFD